jgi:hypothetical protein
VSEHDERRCGKGKRLVPQEFGTKSNGIMKKLNYYRNESITDTKIELAVEGYLNSKEEGQFTSFEELSLKTGISRETYRRRRKTNDRLDWLLGVLECATAVYVQQAAMAGAPPTFSGLWMKQIGWVDKVETDNKNDNTVKFIVEEEGHGSEKVQA